MKVLPILFVVVLAACGGSLSDEQRRALREKMEENRIVRVTEVEITEAAFEEGRRVVRLLDSLDTDSSKIRDFINHYKGEIRFLMPDDETIRLLERQLIDAYLADTTGSFRDNVQEVRNGQGEADTLLYTTPVVKPQPDGSDRLVGIWNIWLPKKEIVKAIGREKPE